MQLHMYLYISSLCYSTLFLSNVLSSSVQKKVFAQKRAVFWGEKQQIRMRIWRQLENNYYNGYQQYSPVFADEKYVAIDRTCF